MSKPTDFSAAFSLLKNHGVEFVVIGGVAARAHYSSYVTMDLDICYSRDKANLEKLAAALATIKATLRGAPPGLKFKLDARMLAAGLNFTLDTELGNRRAW